MDYVSASPFRVPIARLAAAQAVIEERAAKARGKSEGEEEIIENPRRFCQPAEVGSPTIVVTK